MFNVTIPYGLPHEFLENGFYVAILSTGEILACESFKGIYNSCLLHLKDAVYHYRKYAHGSTFYSAVIHCPNGFKCEITVYDMPFYKGVTIERESKIYYCDEVK